MEMKNKKFSIYSRFLILIVGVSLLSFGFIGDDVSGGKTVPNVVHKYNAPTDEGGKKGDAYRLYVNNINLPLDRQGVIANVNIPDPRAGVGGEGGKFGGHTFLFSSGFFLSGYANGVLWANAVASASLVRDYLHGTVAKGSGDPNAVMYVLKSTDPPFGQAWQDWKDAVELGADFYDGDGDGIYDPVDKNGNGIWDPDEDAPDLLGDETVWHVMHDGRPAPNRRWNAVEPLGIEIRQTVFAFASGGAIGNIIFLRYRIKYVGLNKPGEADQLTDVYFGAWADPDLGDYTDDLCGVDVPRNAGYTYNDGDDGLYGSQPPCYMIDYFSGPVEYIPGVTFVDNNGNGIYDDGVDTALDTAYNIRGQLLGIESFPGAKNIPISSFMQYINGNAIINDPNDHEVARNYMLGLNLQGNPINPCTWTLGKVEGGVPCNTIDPRFWYSGDPVTNTGWLNALASDSRQITNAGPFTLKKGEEKEVVLAYVVGQGSSALNSITVARRIDDGAQVIFDQNFQAPGAPPAPRINLASNEEFIDLLWDTPDQFNYRLKAETYDIRFGGYNVYAYKTFNNAKTISNQPNAVLIGRYQPKNFIDNLYKENAQTGGIELLFEAAPPENVLDTNIYKDPATGRIRIRITKDPFTGGKLIKGKPYYFAVTSYGLNYDALVPIGFGNFGDYGDYYLTAQSFVQEVENVVTLNQIVFGEDIYSPPVAVQSGNKVSGGSKGRLQYDIINKAALTGNNYRVNFAIDSFYVPPSPNDVAYSAKWSLVNTTTNTVLVDGSRDYLFGSPAIDRVATEGFIVKLSNEVPELNTTVVKQTSTDWANASLFYLAPDMGTQSRFLTGGGTALTTLRNNYTRADKIRRVEIRFDIPGKAYRYLNGFVGTAPPLRRNSYVYAEGVVAGAPGLTDPILAEIGRLGVGFVDVPFTAWVEDEAYGEKRQLAVGFIERRNTEGGVPDGVWDPGTNVDNTGEYIFIFNSPYDPNGNQQVYKGNYQAATQVWADIKGYTIPTDANASANERRIASSPFFDVLYTVGISKKDAGTFFSPSDKFIIEVKNYPYTPADVFEFQTRSGGLLSFEEEKSLFERVNVFPNPLYGYNIATSYTNSAADEPFVTFTNLPNEEITIKLYSLSGNLLRTIRKDAGSTSPFLNWDLKNENGLRVASGLYLAIVSSPTYGEKILKFSIIMPQKQLPRY